MAKVAQQKEKDFEKVEPNISFTDMSDEYQEKVFEICRNAYKMQHDGELKYYKDMAQYVKRELEEKFKDSWHVIIGTNFGSFVTYEHKSMILFWLEHIGFLLFKHG